MAIAGGSIDQGLGKWRQTGRRAWCCSGETRGKGGGCGEAQLAGSRDYHPLMSMSMSMSTCLLASPHVHADVKAGFGVVAGVACERMRSVPSAHLSHSPLSTCTPADM